MAQFPIFEGTRSIMPKGSLTYVLILAAFILAVPCMAESLVVKGVYQGKDLYIKNPFAGEGVGFCVYEVLVNGELTRDEVNSSAFAVDFNLLGIKVGSPVEVVINHKEGCSPQVLNPESLKPHSTFELDSIYLQGNVLHWQASKERGSLPYLVEQFRWNKWVKVGEVQGDGTADLTAYAFKLEPYSGVNKVRIRQVDFTRQSKYSPELTYTPGKAVVTFSPRKAENYLYFSSETRYEIFDKYGQLVKTGFGKSVDVAQLKSGEDYYLNYDSSFGETFRKK